MRSALLCLAITAAATGAYAVSGNGDLPYPPHAGRAHPTVPYFGDTQLYTAFSMDAGAFGARRSPLDAYVFAKGHEVTSSTAQRTFYYARVLQLPTPGWTAYDAAHFVVERPENAPMALQDRAYSSPIGYTPQVSAHL